MTGLPVGTSLTSPPNGRYPQNVLAQFSLPPGWAPTTGAAPATAPGARSSSAPSPAGGAAPTGAASYGSIAEALTGRTMDKCLQLLEASGASDLVADGTTKATIFCPTNEARSRGPGRLCGQPGANNRAQGWAAAGWGGMKAVDRPHAGVPAPRRPFSGRPCPAASIIAGPLARRRPTPTPKPSPPPGL